MFSVWPTAVRAVLIEIRLRLLLRTVSLWRQGKSARLLRRVVWCAKDEPRVEVPPLTFAGLRRAERDSLRNPSAATALAPPSVRASRLGSMLVGPCACRRAAAGRRP